MIGYYNYTVILTYIGMISGFVGITAIGNGELKTSLICLMVAAFCDMFDGKVASTMKRTPQEKRFGVQIDSLSDLICFGVLPALIILHCTEKSLIHVIISATYVLCALIRLAWFNVDEEERQNHESGSREVYLGLPVTTAAALIPFYIGLSGMMNLPLGTISSIVLLAIAVAFISPIKMKKPGNVGKIVLVLVGFLALAVVLMGVA